MSVGAHFDRASESDGVVDNWSGASLLPSLYEAVKIEPRRHTYIFIGFTDEEQGEVGSRFYARQMTKEQVAMTDAMVNMDTLGLAPTEVWASHSDKRLTGALVDVATQLNVSVTGVNVDQLKLSTDAEQFAERKIPRITIHSLDTGGLECPHPSHIEGQHFGHAARRLLPNSPTPRGLYCFLRSGCEHNGGGGFALAVE